MYRVLVADDEDMIRRGIIKFLGADSEITVVAQAEDGEIALKLAKEQLPDIMFVDINMPFMDGLSFLEKLGPLRNNIVIIVITGYDDFNYAQQALRLGVFDYLLKPLMEDVFYESLRRAKEKVKSRSAQKKYYDWAKDQLEQNKEKLTGNFMNKLIEGKLSQDALQEQLGFLDIDFPRDPGMTVLHNLNKEMAASLSSLFGGDWTENLLTYAFENIAREVFEPFAPVISFCNEKGILFILCECSPHDKWVAANESLCSLIKQYFSVQVATLQVCSKDYPSLFEAYEHLVSEIDRVSSRTPIIHTIVDYIDQNYSKDSFCIQDVADYVHLSAQHLSRMFRQEMNITLVDYLTNLRIHKAEELLSDPELKMYEIAEKVGYSSQHYFSNAFKRVLGISPMEYRKGGFRR